MESTDGTYFPLTAAVTFNAGQGAGFTVGFEGAYFFPSRVFGIFVSPGTEFKAGDEATKRISGGVTFAPGLIFNCPKSDYYVGYFFSIAASALSVLEESAGGSFPNLVKQFGDGFAGFAFAWSPTPSYKLDPATHKVSDANSEEPGELRYAHSLKLIFAKPSFALSVTYTFEILEFGGEKTFFPQGVTSGFIQ
jgi:hypothetical protein